MTDDWCELFFKSFYDYFNDSEGCFLRSVEPTHRIFFIKKLMNNKLIGNESGLWTSKMNAVLIKFSQLSPRPQLEAR